MFTWSYLIATGEFIAGGPCEIIPSTGQAIVKLSRNPDPRLDRYDGAGGIRRATSQELIAYDAARAGEVEQMQFDGQKMLKAVAIWTAGKLGVSPATAKSEILTIYRGLP